MAKHYIITDELGRILRGFSDDFEQPDANAICICEDGGRHFQLNGVVNPPMIDTSGIPKYKLVSGAVTERSQAEIDADVVQAPAPPTLEERTAALETALLEIVMGGTL